MKVLLVEDDEVLADLLRRSLVAQHYLVEMAAEGQAGWELAEVFEYDLIILDLMLPKLDGISFCQQLRADSKHNARSLNCKTPILLMTAEDATTNRVAGLDAGADDYIVKPFDLNELLARVRALLRRGNVERLPLLEWGQLQLDPSACKVRYNGQPFHLSSKEYSLLELFLRHQERIFSQGTLIEQLWALEDIPTENAIRAQIKGLRKKLKEVGVGDCIETVYGLGYRLKEAQIDKGAGSQGNEKKTEGKESQSEQPTSNQPTHKEAVSEISEFWEQYRAQYCDRLCIIEQAISALHTKNLIEDLRQQAQREAHTLKGSLGLFGLERGSELSHEIEQLLKVVDNLNQEQQAHLAELTLSLRQVLEQPLPKTHSWVEVPNQHRCSQEAVLSRQSRLLIVDNDAVLAQQLAKTASDWNMEAELATNLAQARSLIAQKLPDIVLLDVTFCDLTEDGFGLLAELATYHPQLPVIVFTAQESFAERIKVARLGGKGFLHKPIAPTKVMEMIRATLRQATAQFLQPAYATDAQLLIVDDDAQLLNILRVLLQPWGFQVALLNDPQQFWSTLEEVKPDLLMLDIEMPEISGLDLCQVIRNDLRWGDLPILMLSAHTDDETIQRVFIAGADDYVSKPVRAAELVARVIRRLEYAKVLKKLRGLED